MRTIYNLQYTIYYTLYTVHYTLYNIQYNIIYMTFEEERKGERER